MKNFRVVLVVLVCVAAAVVGMAYYQGWFHVTVDKGKFQQDQRGVRERMGDLEPSLKNKSEPPKASKTSQDAP